MTTIADTDIINSATPLEMRFAGVHPRLYATAAEIEALREKCAREPWAGFLRRVRAQADAAVRRGRPAPGTGDDLRGVGCGTTHLAVAYRLTGEPQYLTALREVLTEMAAREDWTVSLQYGHWAHGAALAYDWLYEELGAELRDAVRQALHRHTERVFRSWGSYENAYPTTYAWNHSAVVHGGLIAACCALWGDVEGPGRWLRMGLEKLRLMADALGEDGASAEGLAYGQYHADFLLKSMCLGEQLLGLDTLTDSRFFRSFPYYLLYHMLPRPGWSPNSTFLYLSDTNGSHWYGPDSHLRLVARRFRDPHAQWLADETARAGVNGESSCFLNLLWYDETVAPEPPDELPTMRHFTDKDLVLLRGGWDDRAAVAALKCGPSNGHHAKRRYRNNVGGGHMHPDAGHVVLHAGGDWLLIDDGYTKKFTAYQNTVLVNGVGQLGEGATWFEDLPFRQGHPEGRILRAEAGETLDYIIADAAPPYKLEARLTKFLRHLLYLKPDVWVLVDELEAEEPSTFEQRFHAPRPFVTAGDSSWAMTAEHGALRLTALGPTPCQGRPFVDQLKGAHGGHHPDYPLDALAVANTAPQRRALFVTLLHAHPAGEEPRVNATLEEQGEALLLTVERPDGSTRLRLHPGQADSAQPIYKLE
ncbi:MAG: heparinase II/III domain-containing protein [Armatimonadota bacterium]